MLSEIRVRASSETDSTTLALLGKAMLLEGHATEAVALLEDASLEAPNDAATWSDLAASYFVLARETDSTGDYARALNASMRLGRAAGDAELAFNRALILGALGLRTTATAAWRSYLDSFSEPGWAEEAREHLSDLETDSRAVRLRQWTALEAQIASCDASPPSHIEDRLVAISPQWTRELLEDRLMPRWAHAVLHGQDNVAARCLATMDQVATALVDATDQRWSKDIVTSLRGLKSGRAAVVGEGIVAYARARDFIRGDEWDSARPLLRRAEALLESERIPLSLAAAAEFASAAYQQRDLVLMTEVLDRSESTAKGRGYGAVTGRILWLRSVAALRRHDLSAAVQWIEQALTHLEQAQETESTSVAHSVAASIWRSIGNRTVSWRHLGRSLGTAAQVRTGRHQYGVLLNASLFALRDGLVNASLVFQEAAVEAAKETGSTTFLVEGLIRRARLRAATGDQTGSDADRQAASDMLSDVRDTDLRSSFALWLRFVSAERLVEQSPREALALLTQNAIAQLSLRESEELPLLFYTRGRAWLAIGDDVAADRDFEQATRAIEREWGRLKRDEQRLGFFDNVAKVFAARIGLAVKHGRMADAFAFAEQSRARALTATSPSRGRLSAKEVQNRLPADTTMLFFIATDTQISALAIARDRLAWCSLDVSPADVVLHLNRWHRTHSRPAGDLRSSADAAWLFDTLIRPFRVAIQSARALAIVPEGPLHAVPFAALVDRNNGRFLLEDVELSVAPSATSAVSSPERGASEPGGRKALIIGSSLAGDQLPALPAIDGEVRSIAEMYPFATVLTGAEATKVHVLREMPRAAIIHFAGHAIAVPHDPDQSRFVMAAGPGEHRSDLLANDITPGAVPNARLVVLAACRTATGMLYRSEGPISLARPFLLAGVPTVVATLWDVDDSTSSTLLSDFHREYSRHGNASAAMREAQLALMRRDAGSSHEATWPAFIVIGSVM